MDDAASPFPRLETTPPVTKMYLGIRSPWITIVYLDSVLCLCVPAAFSASPRLIGFTDNAEILNRADHPRQAARLTPVRHHNVPVSDLPELRRLFASPDRALSVCRRVRRRV